MCGIFGTNKITNNTLRMLPWLAWEMEERGHDSWGMTDGTPERVVKYLGPIMDGFYIPEDWTKLIVHTRAASCGAKTIENAHPFVFEKTDRSGYIVGVHNGIVSNHSELNKKYNRDFEVDSMHIFAHLAEDKDTREIGGYGAIVWGDEGKIFLARFNCGSLEIVRLETGEFVFCSTMDPLRKAARACGLKVEAHWNLTTETLYWLEDDKEDPTKGKILQGNRLPFGWRHATNANVMGYTGSGASSYSSRRSLGGSKHSGTRYLCKICKSYVCEHQGDFAYPGYGEDWGDLALERAIMEAADEAAKREEMHEHKKLVDEVIAQAKAETGTSKGGPIVLPSANVALEGVESNPHIGRHSPRFDERTGKYTCMNCRVVVVPKWQIVCGSCFTVLNRRAASMQLVRATYA